MSILDGLAELLSAAAAEYETQLERGLAELSTMFGRPVALSDDGTIEVSPQEFALLRKMENHRTDYSPVERVTGIPVVVVK